MMALFKRVSCLFGVRGLVTALAQPTRRRRFGERRRAKGFPLMLGGFCKRLDFDADKSAGPKR